MDSEKNALILFNKGLLNIKYRFDPIPSESSNFIERQRLIKKTIIDFCS